MIDILGPVTAAAHGGCVECDPNDDRGDDLFVFLLGGYKIRLCRSHLATLETSLRNKRATEGAPALCAWHAGYGNALDPSCPACAEKRRLVPT